MNSLFEYDGINVYLLSTTIEEVGFIKPRLGTVSFSGISIHYVSGNV